MAKSKRVIKYLDLCSGIGGFRIALDHYNTQSKNIQFQCILSADIKQDAIDTYNINFKEHNEKINIYTIDPSGLDNFDLLCAGFPCQPFSSAGQKKGFNDKRGGLIFKILDICLVHKPRTIILENVYNLIKLDGGKCIQRIKVLFEELGYYMNYKKLDSSNFGCPQSRKRVYIVCHLEKNISFDTIQYSSQRFLMKDIIDYNDKRTDIDHSFAEKIIKLHGKDSVYGCKIGDKRGGKNNIHSWNLEYNGVINSDECTLMEKIMLERRKKHWAKKKDIVWMDGMPLTYKEILTFYNHKNLKQMLDNLVAKNYLRLEKCKDLVELTVTEGEGEEKVVKIVRKRVYKEDSEEGYNICKGKLSFPITKILDPNDISPTLTATDGHKLAVIIDDKYLRKLNIIELKKLCGFPDNFIIPPHVNAFNLFGNMATPPVIKEILKLVYN